MQAKSVRPLLFIIPLPVPLCLVTVLLVIFLSSSGFFFEYLICWLMALFSFYSLFFGLFRFDNFELLSAIFTFKFGGCSNSMGFSSETRGFFLHFCLRYSLLLNSTELFKTGLNCFSSHAVVLNKYTEIAWVIIQYPSTSRFSWWWKIDLVRTFYLRNVSYF